MSPTKLLCWAYRRFKSSSLPLPFPIACAIVMMPAGAVNRIESLSVVSRSASCTFKGLFPTILMSPLSTLTNLGTKCSFDFLINRIKIESASGLVSSSNFLVFMCKKDVHKSLALQSLTTENMDGTTARIQSSYDRPMYRCNSGVYYSLECRFVSYCLDSLV